MRRQSALAALALASLCLAFACGGSDGGGDATSTPAESPTASVSAVPVPPRPASFREYPAGIASYLAIAPAERGGASCLAALYQAWGMAYYSGGRSCRAANTDDDAEDEVIAILPDAGASSPDGTLSFEVAIFDATPGGFTVAHVSPPQSVPPTPPNLLGAVLIDAGQLNGTGGGEVAYKSVHCGAHTCSDIVHIIGGGGDGYRALTPPEGLTQATTSEVRMEDTDGDGAKELLLTGGEIGSVGAGPQRPRTDVYAWDGAVYALRESRPARATYLYHAIVDADVLFNAARYTEAEAAYVQAAGDESLQLWKDSPTERDELSAYALYRAGLSVVMSASDPQRASAHFERASRYAPALHAQLAGAFRAAYAAKGDVSIACSAVNEDVQRNLAEYQAFWDYGYANPAFNAEGICPF